MNTDMNTNISTGFNEVVGENICIYTTYEADGYSMLL